MSRDRSSDIQNRIDYAFQDPRLLLQALTHRSYVNEIRDSDTLDNERLEFLGDAVLGLIVSQYLLSVNPDADEGLLSRARASIVNGPVLDRVARSISLGSHLRLGRGEERTEGREKPSVLADALEAVIGAVFLDGGLHAAERCVKNLFSLDLSRNVSDAEDRDFKTLLQERTQKAYNQLPGYSLLRASGPDHRKIFDVEVRLGKTLLGKGSGRTKKEAEQNAAQMALKKMGSGND